MVIKGEITKDWEDVEGTPRYIDIIFFPAVLSLISRFVVFIAQTASAITGEIFLIWIFLQVFYFTFEKIGFLPLKGCWVCLRFILLHFEQTTVFRVIFRVTAIQQ